MDTLALSTTLIYKIDDSHFQIGEAMAARGVHFALTPDERARLLSAAGDDDAVLRVIHEEIEDAWDETWLSESDKAWDAIHRCLTDGTLSFESSSPLHWCILGGRQIYQEDDYVVSFVDSDQVQQVATAIEAISKQQLRLRYDSIATDEYGPLTDEDFEYTWDSFAHIRSLFQRAAKAGRSIIFTVDQ